MTPKAIILRTAGTNCDAEMVRAFALAGATPDLVHLDRLIAEPQRLDDYDLVGFPGGFSYGDDIASGRVFALRVRERLYPALRAAVERGACMIGACNGFQIMVQIGLLPGCEPGAWPADAPPARTTALTDNVGGRFIDRWLRMEINPASPCIWTRGLSADPQAMMLPIAHGEGRFVARTSEVLAQLEGRNQVAIRYADGDNVNGSTARIAGICDPSGRIFGLMPHPERYLDWSAHPFATALPPGVASGDTPGLRMFQNAVEHVRAAAMHPAGAR